MFWRTKSYRPEGPCALACAALGYATLNLRKKLYVTPQFAKETVRHLSGYYLLRNGEFAYNKSTSGDGPWGAVKRLEKYEKGCVSTLYICFGLDDADSNFIVTYYETDRWYKAVQMIAAEGARNHGLLNISPDDFFDTALTLPSSREEQERIGGPHHPSSARVALLTYADG